MKCNRYLIVRNQTGKTYQSQALFAEYNINVADFRLLGLVLFNSFLVIACLSSSGDKRYELTELFAKLANMIPVDLEEEVGFGILGETDTSFL